MKLPAQERLPKDPNLDHVWKHLLLNVLRPIQVPFEPGCIGMSDEVDEGTAVFKVTKTPPTQRHFVTHDAMPSGWYLRLVGTGTGLLREKRAVPTEILIQP